VETVLADPESREDPTVKGERDYGLPRLLERMNEEERAQLYHLVEKKAWIKATEIAPLSDEEESKVALIEKKFGHREARKAESIFYRRHQWDSLRWFLFGGLVDIPIQENPKRAWDPVTNPFLKIRMQSFAWTQDEHDEAKPFKRLPDKQYLRLLAYAWVHEPLLAIPKSRQMMVTWLFCATAVHETLFRPAKTTAWISKKFDDANAHIEKRVQGVADRLPKNRLHVPKYRFIKGQFESSDSGSIIMAMGEEAKGLRQYTFSWIFDDETAFQEQASEAIQAALPTVNGGGRFTLVSSANGKESFYEIISENGRIACPAGA
jgi:hypothetical protein